MPDLKTSPLHERHVALGAKMADFGGWDMPIEYPGGGVVAEHTAVRERVGIFDVSHLGKASVVGPGIDSARRKKAWSSDWQKYWERNSSWVQMI